MLPARLLALLRFLYRLVLGAWVGAVLCFAVVVAPALFQALSPADAGSVVRLILPKLDVFTLAAGPLLVALAVAHDGTPRGVRQVLRVIALVTMVGLSAVSLFVVTARMEELRALATPSIPALAREDPIRQEFGRLHGVSTLLMGLELLCAFVALAAGVTRARQS